MNRRGQAGRSAQSEYRRRRRVHRRRAAGLLPLVAVGAVAAGIVTARTTGAPPLGFAAAGLVVAAYARASFGETRDAAAWRIGAQAERVTAYLLRGVERAGMVVLYDRALPGSRANIDALIVAHDRVLAVDTKRWRRDARVRVRHGTLWCGSADQSHAVAVNRWIAERVARELSCAAGASVPVLAVIAVHGARVPRGGLVVDGVVVLAAGQLPRYLGRVPVWRRDEVAAVAAAAATAFPGKP
ncbi:NERD domain-containing protein (plasmid) [Streptomycetaceae bacterium NBC_01309]